VRVPIDRTLPKALRHLLGAIAQREKQELTGGTRAFINTHTECSDQQVLPLWYAAGES